MFLPIQDAEQIKRSSLNVRQRFRVDKSRKKYAVFHADKLHLVDDLERLIFDTLRASDLYDIEIYQLR